MRFLGSLEPEIREKIQRTVYVFCSQKRFNQLPIFDEVVVPGLRKYGGEVFIGGNLREDVTCLYIFADPNTIQGVVRDVINGDDKNVWFCFVKELEGKYDFSKADFVLAITTADLNNVRNVLQVLNYIDSKMDYTYDEDGWVKKQTEIFKAIGT